MLKNIAIVILLITNICTVFYIYEHFKPERNVTVNTKTEVKRPDYYYKVRLRDGGEAKATGYFDKGTTIDLVDNGSVTMTIAKKDLLALEKVYYSTGTTKKVITSKTTTNKYN